MPSIRRIVIGSILLGMLYALVPVSVQADQMIQIEGSDTIWALARAWTLVYAKQHPAIQFSVKTGGTGKGISAFLDKKADLATASRLMDPTETALAQSRGITCKAWLVGLDGIAVVVNPANHIEALSLEELKAIYSGAKPNWKDFNGQDSTILLYSRDTNSGTYSFFKEHILNNGSMPATTIYVPLNDEIIRNVRLNQDAIGYLGMGHLEEAGRKLKIVKIKQSPHDPGTIPEISTVVTKQYPISRDLYLYSEEKPSPEIQQFIDFVVSAQGQELVGKMGFVPIKPNSPAGGNEKEK